MEALSSSTFLSKVPESHLGLHQSSRCSIKLLANQALFSKSNDVFLGSATWRPASSCSRPLALSRKSKEVAGDGAENPSSEINDGGLISENNNTAAEEEEDEKNEDTEIRFLISENNNTAVEGSADTLKTTTPLPIGLGSGTGGGGRAGLFRTPISGGVQSATSAHGLPRPALAVRNLMEQARFAHLCTVMSRMHHRREGYPFGSLVDFAPDSMGHPIFSFSPLAIHTRNLLADPHCTLVVQIPGWSGLSNARVTIFGDVYPLPEYQQEWAHKQYIAKHQQGPSQQWGNFYYFRMQNIRDIYFIGGFGTVAWVDVKEYEDLTPDKIALEGGEQCLKELNAIFSKPLKELLSTEIEVDDAALISIDSKGTDVRVRQGAQFNIQRISFEEGHSIETLEQAKAALREMIGKRRLHSVHK